MQGVKKNKPIDNKKKKTRKNKKMRIKDKKKSSNFVD